MQKKSERKPNETEVNQYISLYCKYFHSNRRNKDKLFAELFTLESFISLKEIMKLRRKALQWKFNLISNTTTDNNTNNNTRNNTNQRSDYQIKKQSNSNSNIYEVPRRTDVQADVSLLPLDPLLQYDQRIDDTQDLLMSQYLKCKRCTYDLCNSILHEVWFGPFYVRNVSINLIRSNRFCTRTDKSTKNSTKSTKHENYPLPLHGGKLWYVIRVPLIEAQYRQLLGVTYDNKAIGATNVQEFYHPSIYAKLVVTDFTIIAIKYNKNTFVAEYYETVCKHTERTEPLHLTLFEPFVHQDSKSNRKNLFELSLRLYSNWEIVLEGFVWNCAIALGVSDEILNFLVMFVRIFSWNDDNSNSAQNTPMLTNDSNEHISPASPRYGIDEAQVLSNNQNLNVEEIMHSKVNIEEELSKNLLFGLWKIRLNMSFSNIYLLLFPCSPSSKNSILGSYDGSLVLSSNENNCEFIIFDVHSFMLESCKLLFNQNLNTDYISWVKIIEYEDIKVPSGTLSPRALFYVDSMYIQYSTNVHLTQKVDDHKNQLKEIVSDVWGPPVKRVSVTLYSFEVYEDISTVRQAMAVLNIKDAEPKESRTWKSADRDTRLHSFNVTSEFLLLLQDRKYQDRFSSSLDILLYDTFESLQLVGVASIDIQSTLAVPFSIPVLDALHEEIGCVR